MEKIRNDGFVSLLGVLLTLVIISVLSYMVFKNYYSATPQSDKSIEKPLAEAGINTTSYSTVLDSTKTRINDLSQQQMKAAEQLEEFDVNQLAK